MSWKYFTKISLIKIICFHLNVVVCMGSFNVFQKIKPSVGSSEPECAPVVVSTSSVSADLIFHGPRNASPLLTATVLLPGYQRSKKKENEFDSALLGDFRSEKKEYETQVALSTPSVPLLGDNGSEKKEIGYQRALSTPTVPFFGDQRSEKKEILSQGTLSTPTVSLLGVHRSEKKEIVSQGTLTPSTATVSLIGDHRSEKKEIVSQGTVFPPTVSLLGDNASEKKEIWSERALTPPTATVPLPGGQKFKKKEKFRRVHLDQFNQSLLDEEIVVDSASTEVIQLFEPELGFGDDALPDSGMHFVILKNEFIE